MKLLRFLGGPKGLKYPGVSGINATIGINKYVTHNYGAAAADWTLAEDEQWASVIKITNASGAVNIVLSEAIGGKIYLVHNECGATVTFKVTGQTGDTLINDKAALFYCNGTDMVNAGTELVSAASPSNSPSNSPSASASNSPSASASNSPSSSPSASPSNSPSASPS